MKLQLIQRFEKIFNQKINNFLVFLQPISYYNIHFLRNQFPDLKIPMQKNDYEIGYAKFKVSIYMSNQKNHKNLDSYFASLKDHDIVPVVSYFVYFPTFNKKLACDSKNFNFLVFNFLQAATINYVEFNQSQKTFITPTVNDGYKDILATKTIQFMQKLINEDKMGVVVEKQLKQIVETPDLINFDMSILPNEFNFQDFLSFPYISQDKLIIQNNQDVIDNEKTFLQIQKLFFQQMQHMYLMDIKD